MDIGCSRSSSFGSKDRTGDIDDEVIHQTIVVLLCIDGCVDEYTRYCSIGGLEHRCATQSDLASDLCYVCLDGDDLDVSHFSHSLFSLRPSM